MKKRILVYGDSNAWGFVPGTGKRYGENQRWPKIVESMLGDNVELIEDCISGRTIFDDPYDVLRSGILGLGFALNAHAPLDMVIFHLGANDLKYADAEHAAEGIREIVGLVKNADSLYPLPMMQPHFNNKPLVLIISPVRIHKLILILFPESPLVKGVYESLKLKTLFKDAAEECEALYLDADEIAAASTIDCIHMDEASHLSLARAVASKIREYL